MKKIIALTLIIMGVYSSSKGQTGVEIQWGEDVGKETEILKILGETENGAVYALTTRKKDFFLEKYKPGTFVRDFSTPLTFPTIQGQKTELADVFYLNGTLMLFVVAYNKDKRIYNIHGYNLNERSRIASKEHAVMEIAVENKSRSGDFGFRVSQDKTKLLVFHSAPHKKGENKWVVNAKVMTDDFSVIKEVSEEFPMDAGRREAVKINNFIVSDNAGFYMAVSTSGYEKSVKQIVTKDLKILQYEPANGFEKKEIQIDIEGKSATSIALTIDPDGNLLGGGFYSLRNQTGIARYEGIAGIYYTKIDRLSGKAVNTTTDEFKEAFAATILPERQAQKGKLVPDYFVPRQIIAKDDGGVVLLAEYYVKTERQANGQRTVSYTFGPVIVCNIAPTGDIIWARSINKHQISAKNQIGIGAILGAGLSFGASFWFDLAKDQTIYHSYLVGVDSNKLNLIYNDHPKNLEVTHFRETRMLRGYKGGVPVVVTIEADGSLKKEILMEKDKSEVVLRPKIYYQDGYDSVIIYGSRRKMNKLGRVSF